MKQYRNKYTKDIIKAELRIEKPKDHWNPYHAQLYVSTFRNLLFTSLKSLEREWEELTTNK